MRQMFFQFHQEYLTHLRRFHYSKGCYSKNPIKVGDIVLIKNESPSRNFWPIARVTAIGKVKDGIIRQVYLQKYLPFTINAALRETLHNKKGNQKLTKKQVQHLTGYFEDQEYPHAVKNLVPYELWKGDQAEPEDMDTGQVHEGTVETDLDVEVKFENTRLHGSNAAFYAMAGQTRPASQIHRFDSVDQEATVRENDVWYGSINVDPNPNYHEHFVAAWDMADSLF